MDYDQVLRSDGAKEFRLPKGVTEDNWKSRMSFCANLTEAITNYGRDRLPKDFLVQMESLLNNILECAVSERTQLSNAACRLLERLPEVLEKDIYPHLDRLMPVLLKLCANTKQVIVKAAAAAVNGVILHAPYHPRTLWHICQVFEEKPAGPKVHGTGWLQTILKDFHRSIDLNKESRMIARAISLALEDADPTVRTKSRTTYWTYSKMDPEAAQDIMEKLNNHARTALQNDPSNPDKKATASKKEPPRPRSALADVRKEQARKKRAEEEAQKQKKALNVSTTGHEGTDLPESRKDRPKREERTQLSKATTTDRTVDGWQPSQKGPMNVLSTHPSINQSTHPSTHKKTLSQDREAITKSSANSRLLSAPVRRPRINVTPINAPNATQPASRTGHTNAPHKEKEQPKDSRPTSSSSWKSASAAPAFASPKRKGIPVASPKSKGTPASSEPLSPTPESQLPYVPDGKENHVSHLPKGLRSLNATSYARPPIVIPDYHENANTRRPPVPSPIFGPIPPDTTTIENRMTREGSYNAETWEANEVDSQDKHDERGPLRSNIKYMSHHPEPSYEPIEIKTRQSRLDLKAARNFLLKNLPSIQRQTFDPLTFRKLKQIVEQYPTDLIEDETTYDQLFKSLCLCLGSREDLDPQDDQIADVKADRPFANKDYNRSLILQMSIPLLKNYHSWSRKYWAMWIESMIYYRCTLTAEDADRRVKYIWRSITNLIEGHKDPVQFVASVSMAIENGEQILLPDTLRREADMAREREARGPPTEVEMENLSHSPLASPSNAHMGSRKQNRVSSAATCASINPYSARSAWKTIGEWNVPRAGIYPHSGAAEEINRYMKEALMEHNIATIEHDRPYPKALPLLVDFSLQVYTEILKRLYALNNTLEEEYERELCTIAERCFSSYDYMIKRSVVPFIKWLYVLMGEQEKKFFQYFPEEAHRNLLEYYLFESVVGQREMNKLLDRE